MSPKWNSCCMEEWENRSHSLFTFHFHALEKEMATHSSILAWRIPGTEEPSGLLSMGSPGVRHDWSDLAAAAPVSQIHLMHSNSMHYCFQRWPPQFILFPFAIWMWISCHRVCAHSQSLSALWPTDCSPPGSSVHQTSQARILEWVAISFSRGSCWPRDWTHLSGVSYMDR